jgi:prepilin-type N-terminal cleavage/methylation domain-containing protein
MKILDLKMIVGFTLDEIIAVLVILGILAEVCILKYMSILDETTARSTQAAIAEIKGRLPTAQAKHMMRNGCLTLTSPMLYNS